MKEGGQPTDSRAKALARVGEQIGLEYASENVMPRAARHSMFGVSSSDVFP